MNLKARMFNRKASDPKNKPDRILTSLALQSGNSVADIGAGGGYFSLRFAEAVGRDGFVFAVDTNPDFLEFIKERVKEEGLDNIETVLATEDGLSLPESVDLIFMRNVCHHIPSRISYFEKLNEVLGEGGRIAILEYRKAKSLTFRGLFGHYVPKKTIIEEMTQAGFQLEEDLDFLPDQSFTIFSIESTAKKARINKSSL